MELDATRGGLGPNLDLRKRRAWIFVGLVAVAAVTATSVPWNWRLPLIYLVAAFVFRLLIRTKHHDLNMVGPAVAMAGTLGIAVRTFYGSAWFPGIGIAHVGALYALAILSGFVLAEWVRPVDGAR